MVLYIYFQRIALQSCSILLVTATSNRYFLFKVNCDKYRAIPKYFFELNCGLDPDYELNCGMNPDYELNCGLDPDYEPNCGMDPDYEVNCVENLHEYSLWKILSPGGSASIRD